MFAPDFDHSPLQSENIIHCDLSARNCLVLIQRDVCTIKIADLGMAELLPSNATTVMKRIRIHLKNDLGSDGNVPVRWSAPEVLSNHQVSKASDVWSFG